MSVQGIVAGVIVAAAVAYLVWKMGLSGRKRARRSKTPDVPVSALTRKRGDDADRG